MDETALRRAVDEAYKRLRAAVSAYSRALHRYHAAVEKRHALRPGDRGASEADPGMAIGGGGAEAVTLTFHSVSLPTSLIPL